MAFVGKKNTRINYIYVSRNNFLFIVGDIITVKALDLHFPNNGTVGSNLTQGLYMLWYGMCMISVLF